MRVVLKPANFQGDEILFTTFSAGDAGGIPHQHLERKKGRTTAIWQRCGRTGLLCARYLPIASFACPQVERVALVGTVRVR